MKWVYKTKWHHVMGACPGRKFVTGTESTYLYSPRLLTCRNWKAADKKSLSSSLVWSSLMRKLQKIYNTSSYVPAEIRLWTNMKLTHLRCLISILSASHMAIQTINTWLQTQANHEPWPHSSGWLSHRPSWEIEDQTQPDSQTQIIGMKPHTSEFVGSYVFCLSVYVCM